VVAISTTLGARSGLLIRDRRGLEEARSVTAVFFDKTGTLTRGECATHCRLSKATYRKLIQNVWWAAGYNIFAIPLAAGALAPWGIVLPAAIGAVLMSLSTVVVALNAQLLRQTDL
jgi:cation transport ATPase